MKITDFIKTVLKYGRKNQNEQIFCMLNSNVLRKSKEGGQKVFFKKGGVEILFGVAKECLPKKEAFLKNP